MNPLVAATLSPACTEEHRAYSAVYARAELNQAFGVTAVGQIPLSPGWVTLRNDTGTSVQLSKLECGHYAMTSPATVEAFMKAHEEAVYAPEGSTAREALALLLADARAGLKVNPHDVAAAKERITLEELAEEGRAERAAAELARAEAEARETLIAPLQDLVDSSAEKVQELHTAALDAIRALLDAVDEHMQDQDEAATTLTSAGVDPDEVRPPARGYLRETVIGDRRYPMFLKQEYLVTLLNSLKTGKHRNSFYGIEGRNLGAGIPPNIQGAPNPEE